MNLTLILRILTLLLILPSFIHLAKAQDNKQQSSSTPPKVIRKSTGVLQNDAINRVEPVYPPLARAAKVSGPVTVEVTVDEEGKVISARAISGHPLLKDSAVEAARGWKFNPTKLSGVPVRVIGNLIFIFTLSSEEKNDDADREARSIATLEKKVRDNPDLYEARYELGIAYIKARRYSEAILVLKEAIRINPKSAQAYYELGGAYTRIRLYEEAARMYSEAVVIDPGYEKKGEAYFGLGASNLLLDRYEEAAKAFTESIRISPEVSSSHYGLGIASFMLGDHERAIGSFKRLLEIERLKPGPLLIDGHFWLGRAYLMAGDKQSALKQYESLKRIGTEMAERLLNEIKER